MTTRPWSPAGVPQPAPLRTDASPASQALAAGAVVVTLAALATRMDSTLWFAAPTAALLLGIVLGLQLDLRRWLAAVPGLVVALATLVVLSVLWGMSLGSFDVVLPYAPVPLAAVVAFGTDWCWVERLRPTTVASGAILVLTLTRGDVAATLPLALLWFAVAAAALWSLRRDAGRAVPTPVPLDGSAGPDREPGAYRTAVAVAGSWLVAGLVVALVGLVPLWFGPPEGDPRVEGPTTFRPGSGSGAGAGEDTPGGGDIGPGGEVGDDTIGDPGVGRDVDGDGIIDRDIDGDGIPDVDIDGDGIPDVDRDGDGIPDPPGDGRGASSLPETGAGTPPGEGGTARLVDQGDGTRIVLRVLGIAVLVLLVAALVALAVRALVREQARRRALAARPWAVRLAERLEREGARRGRDRRRDEPVTRYATALAGDVLAHDRLADVGTALSTALFGGAAPSDATGEWAAGVVDEAVAANPVPTWFAGVRDRLRRRS